MGMTGVSGCLIVLKQPCPFVQIFDLSIKGYTAAQSARLKTVLISLNCLLNKRLPNNVFKHTILLPFCMVGKHQFIALQLGKNLTVCAANAPRIAHALPVPQATTALVRFLIRQHGITIAVKRQTVMLIALIAHKLRHTASRRMRTRFIYHIHKRKRQYPHTNIQQRHGIPIA